VILIVTCLSKWIAKDNSQGFDVCVVQRPLDLREIAALIARQRRASATYDATDAALSTTFGRLPGGLYRDYRGDRRIDMGVASIIQ
jgi:hypothetical protein